MKDAAFAVLLLVLVDLGKGREAVVVAIQCLFPRNGNLLCPDNCRT
jgi:hypothetical protein